MVLCLRRWFFGTAAWHINLEKNPGLDDELELFRDEELCDFSCVIIAGGPSVHALAAKCGTYWLLCFRNLRRWLTCFASFSSVDGPV
jgi:hypothetical protein